MTFHQIFRSDALWNIFQIDELEFVINKHFYDETGKIQTHEIRGFATLDQCLDYISDCYDASIEPIN